MLKENTKFFNRIERLGDIVLILLMFLLAYYGRESLIYWDNFFNWGLPFSRGGIAPLKDYGIVIVTALISYPLLLHQSKAYTSMRLSSSLQLINKFIFVSLLVFLIISAVLFTLKLELSRTTIALFCILMVFALSVERILVLKILRYLRRRGFNYRNIVICGLSEQAIKLVQEILLRPELGLRIRAFVSLNESISKDKIDEFKKELKISGLKSIGKIVIGDKAFEKVLTGYVIDEIIFCDLVNSIEKVEKAIITSSIQGVRTTIYADLFSFGIIKSGISYFGDIPLIHFQTPPGDLPSLSIKRLIDITVSALLMIVLSPFFVLIAILIKVTSPGSIIFRQKRIGLNGRFFNFYKFRSMYDNAEEQKEELKKKNEMEGPVFKIKEDPRVTPLGAVLRRFSLDELPQLWNVLIGEMSLVGPRPPLPEEVHLYQREERRRLSMRPGLTCTWQVSGRNKINDFRDWVKLDLDYIDNWSLAKDLKLLIKTIPAVLFGKGAH